MTYIQSAITWGFYPFMLLVTGLLVWGSIDSEYALGISYAWLAGIRFTLLQSVELFFPCEKKWTITLASFWRDIKYGIANFATMRAWGFLVALITIELAVDNPGLIAGAPLWVEVLMAALVYEFFQYWFHRLCHEGKGWMGDKLWKIHAAHHLPDKVYLLMHPVGHPLNYILMVWMVPTTTWLLGVSQEAVMIWFAYRGLHGTLSHFNVEIRAGWLNYIFIGTELHRYHHSAVPGEGKNYGSLLAFWDQVFGTFVYRPGINPERLGVHMPEEYPHSTDIFSVLILPFKKSQ